MSFAATGAGSTKAEKVRSQSTGAKYTPLLLLYESPGHALAGPTNPEKRSPLERSIRAYFWPATTSAPGPNRPLTVVMPSPGMSEAGTEAEAKISSGKPLVSEASTGRTSITREPVLPWSWICASTEVSLPLWTAVNVCARARLSSPEESPKATLP